MAKESVEGYENGNWPSATGNPSGGGRGNAEPSYGWDDDYDDRPIGGSNFLLPTQVAERNRIRMEVRPQVPFNAEEIEGTLCCLRGASGDDPFRPLFILAESPWTELILHPSIYAYHVGERDWPTLRMNLVGDRLKLKVVRSRNVVHVYKFTNLSLTQKRIDQEKNEFVAGSRHELENELRQCFGRFSRNCSVIYREKRDQSHPRWFIKSGDYLCKHIAFADKRLASYWMDLHRDEIEWREGPEFKLCRGLFKCSIVDKHGNLPKHWDIPKWRFTEDYMKFYRYR